MAYSGDDSALLRTLRCLVHDLAFDGPAPRPRHAQGPARPHGTDHGRGHGHRRRDRTRRLFAVADLGKRSLARPGAVAGERRRDALQCADVGGPHENPAPLRPAGARRSQLQFPFARGARSAEARQRGYGRGKGAADRPDLPVDRGPPRHAGARHARPHHLSALSGTGATPVDDGLSMRAFRDGSPYSNEDLFLASAPASTRAARATA